MNNILLKYVGLDKIIETVIGKMGHVSKIYLTGDYASGRDSGIVDLLFVGMIDKSYLLGLVGKAESLTSKKIRYLTFTDEEWLKRSEQELSSGNTILLWQQGIQHEGLKFRNNDI